MPTYKLEETPVLLWSYTYFLPSSSTFTNAPTVGCIVNWLPAADCQRDIRTTTSPAEEAVRKRLMISGNDGKSGETVRLSWEPVLIKGNPKIIYDFSVNQLIHNSVIKTKNLTAKIKIIKIEQVCLVYGIYGGFKWIKLIWVISIKIADVWLYLLSDFSSYKLF